MNRRNFFKTGLASVLFGMFGSNLLATTFKPDNKLVNSHQPNTLSKNNLGEILATIKKDIETIASAYFGELNDETSRKNISKHIADMLNQKYYITGIINNYRVVCNESNNSPTSMDKGYTNVDVYLQLTNSINYHVIQCVISGFKL
jgi:hypothetical protein